MLHFSSPPPRVADFQEEIDPADTVIVVPALAATSVSPSNRNTNNHTSRNTNGNGSNGAPLRSPIGDSTEDDLLEEDDDDWMNQDDDDDEEQLGPALGLDAVSSKQNAQAPVSTSFSLHPERHGTSSPLRERGL